MRIILLYIKLMIYNFISFRYDISDENFEKAVAGGAESHHYTSLVSWISKELQYFLKLDDHINATQSVEDLDSFLIEVSTFLKELGLLFFQPILSALNSI